MKLLRALNNEAYESLQLALLVKIDEKKDNYQLYNLGKMNGDMIFLKPSTVNLSKKFSLIFMKDSGKFTLPQY